MFIRQFFKQENGRRTAYWALVESHRTATGPRQRVVAWLGKLDEAGRLGVKQAASCSSLNSGIQRRPCRICWALPKNGWMTTVCTVRPIWHTKEERVLAHIFVCFLAYVLWKTLAQLCDKAGLGSEPRRVLAELSDIRSMDVVLPTRSGVEIRSRCISKPTDHQQILLEKLRLKLPSKIIQKKM